MTCINVTCLHVICINVYTRERRLVKSLNAVCNFFLIPIADFLPTAKRNFTRKFEKKHSTHYFAYIDWNSNWLVRTHFHRHRNCSFETRCTSKKEFTRRNFSKSTQKFQHIFFLILGRKHAARITYKTKSSIGSPLMPPSLALIFWQTLPSSMAFAFWMVDAFKHCVIMPKTQNSTDIAK